VKREYNVDESRTYITGISDGGTGVYFFAMRVASPWAACMPLNGHPLVIANPDTGADGQLYVGNLVNCPLHAVNGGKDPLYPAASVEPLIAMFKKANVFVDWDVYPDAGHDVSWWPQERPKYEAYLAKHPRVAHPASVSVGDRADGPLQPVPLARHRPPREAWLRRPRFRTSTRTRRFRSWSGNSSTTRSHQAVSTRRARATTST
jgi:hypothetical protein